MLIHVLLFGTAKEYTGGSQERPYACSSTYAHVRMKRSACPYIILHICTHRDMHMQTRIYTSSS